MKRFMILTLFLVLGILFSSTAFAATYAFEIKEFSPEAPTVKAGDVINYKMVINAKENITNLSFNATDPYSNSASFPKPQIAAAGSIIAGFDKTILYTLSIPAGQAQGLYIGTILIYDAANSNILIQKKDYAVFIGAGGISQISLPSEVSISVEPGDDQDLEFIITNTGSKDVTITIPSMKFTDGDDNEIVIIPKLSSMKVNAGSSVTAVMNVDVDKGYELGTESGTLTLDTDAGISPKPSLTVKVNVNPLSCEKSIQGSNLKISIDEPDTSDEFEPGQDIPVTLNVENNGNSDMDVVVEAVLYDIDDGKKIDSYKSSKKEVKDDEDVDFEFKLQLSDDFDTDNELKLFIKAYEYKEEETQCNEDEQSIDTTEVEDRISIKSFTLSPMTIQCGSLVDAFVDLRNIGTNDQSVNVNIQSTPLGIYQATPTVDLGTSSSDKSEVTSVSFKVPLNTKEGSYTVTATASYGSQKISAEQTLQVYCPATATTNIVSTQARPITELTGATTYTQKGVFDYFDNTGSEIPMSVWILIDVLVALGIIALLIVIFRRK